MARRQLSPEGEILIDTLRAEKAAGFSGRTIAERFGFGSESTLRDYLSGRRQPSARDAERALGAYADTLNTARFVPTREHGVVEAEPLNRKGWSTLGKYDSAIKEAREKGDWSIVEQRMGKNPKIKTRDGEITLPTDKETLTKNDNAGLYTGRDQKYRSPKKSKKRKSSSTRRRPARARRRAA